MTLSQLAFWRNNSSKKAKVNGGGGVKQFLSRISGAFMLPISVMSIAGLFLGVGAAIASHANGNIGLEKFGSFIKNMGDPVFGAMPLLFCAAIVIAFTDEAGVGVFAAIIGMLVFAALQSVFIDSVDHIKTSTKNVEGYTYGKILNGKVDEKDGTLMFYKSLHDGFKVLFAAGGRDADSMEHLVGSTLGIKSLNTSIFGGIIVGAIVAYLYNKFHTIELPAMISFFGGKRFVALVTIVAMIPVAFGFLLFWPWIGKGLSAFGHVTGKAPVGVESLIFGFIERSLIPFGLHHVFYAPLWWTSAGGDAVSQLGTHGIKGGQAASGWLADNKLVGKALDVKDGLFQVMKDHPDSWKGDSYTWIAASGLKYDTISWTINKESNSVVHTKKVFTFFADELHLKLGRYMQGKFPFMIFALPAAGAAMVMAAPKENRKLALGTIFPAALTSFLTGVTEPIEFTFLFLAPWLFWGFHAVMAAFSFMLMNFVGAHVGMTFSGGFLDLMIYGALPFAKGTAFWWVFIIGPAYAVIYYFVFFFAIKKFNLETPGRGMNTKLFTKADYKKSKTAGKPDGQVVAIVDAFGGWDNITKMANCATRLRYDVKVGSKVDVAALKAAGAAGVVKVSAKHFQAIFGPVAEQLNGKIKAAKGTVSDVKSNTAPKAVAKTPTTVKKAPAKKSTTVRKAPAKKSTTVRKAPAKTATKK